MEVATTRSTHVASPAGRRGLAWQSLALFCGCTLYNTHVNLILHVNVVSRLGLVTNSDVSMCVPHSTDVMLHVSPLGSFWGALVVVFNEIAVLCDCRSFALRTWHFNKITHYTLYQTSSQRAFWTHKCTVVHIAYSGRSMRLLCHFFYYKSVVLVNHGQINDVWIGYRSTVWFCSRLNMPEHLD